MLIFGYAVTNEFRNAPIAVIDQAHDALSRELISELTATGYFDLIEQPATAEELDGLFRSGAVKMGMAKRTGTNYTVEQPRFIGCTINKRGRSILDGP